MVTLKSIISDLNEENIDKVVEAGWGKRGSSSSSRSSSSSSSSSRHGRKGGNKGGSSRRCGWYCCNGRWSYGWH